MRHTQEGNSLNCSFISEMMFARLSKHQISFKTPTIEKKDTRCVVCGIASALRYAGSLFKLVRRSGV